jgi:hypothetical protein
VREERGQRYADGMKAVEKADVIGGSKKCMHEKKMI